MYARKTIDCPRCGAKNQFSMSFDGGIELCRGQEYHVEFRGKCKACEVGFWHYHEGVVKEKQ